MTNLLQILTGNPNAGTSPLIRKAVDGTTLAQDQNNTVANSNEFGTSLRLMENLPIPADQLQALIMLFLMWKDRPLLRDIAKMYFKTLESTMGHLAQAGAGNLITAWTHPILIANILEHNYMIAAGAAGGMEASTQWIAGAMTASNVLASIFGSKGFDVPTTLILAGVGNPESAELLRAAHGQPETRRGNTG